MATPEGAPIGPCARRRLGWKARVEPRGVEPPTSRVRFEFGSVTAAHARPQVAERDRADGEAFVRSRRVSPGEPAEIGAEQRPVRQLA